MRVLGIMSGTSLDGVDYVVCSIESASKIRFEEHWTADFPKELQGRLHRAAANQSTTFEVGELHHELGRFYADATGDAAADLVGMHGQTIFHHPGKATLQIGEPAYLAEKLRVPVVSNFRAADIAAGGQGAPLATLFHRHVFAREGKHITVDNLGGISNVTSLDWRSGSEPRVLAFDTGPGNILIDMAVRHFSAGKETFDRDGSHARKGKVDQGLWLKLMKNDYFRREPPKSTGRELFGEALFAEVMKHATKFKLVSEDVLATLVELTAGSIANAHEWYLRTVDEVIFCGGGARNSFLRARIESALREVKADIRVSTSAEHGWDPQVIEGAAFALLAWLTWHKQPGNIPVTTGAKSARVLGQISF